MDRDALLKRRNHVDTWSPEHQPEVPEEEGVKLLAESCWQSHSSRLAAIPFIQAEPCVTSHSAFHGGVGAWGGGEIPSFAGVIPGIRSRTAGIWLLEQQTYSYIILLKLMAIIEKHMLLATCAPPAPPLAALCTAVLKETIPSLFYFSSPLSPP